MPSLSGIEWVQADVREFPLGGYDVVRVLGLFYHLELDDQLALLARARPSILVLDTHVALRVEHQDRG